MSTNLVTTGGAGVAPARAVRPDAQNMVSVIVAGAPARNALAAWLQSRRDELARGEQAVEALKAAGAGPTKLARVRERLRFLRKCVEVMELGYVPIPHFDSVKLNLDVEALPAAALMAVGEANALGVFDEVRFVTGRAPRNQGGSRPRVAQRDPLLVGVVRTPEHRYTINRNGWDETVIVPSREEHFLLAWWRPEDERDEELF